MWPALWVPHVASTVGASMQQSGGVSFGRGGWSLGEGRPLGPGVSSTCKKDAAGGGTDGSTRLSRKPTNATAHHHPLKATVKLTQFRETPLKAHPPSDRT